MTAISSDPEMQRDAERTAAAALKLIHEGRLEALELLLDGAHLPTVVYLLGDWHNQRVAGALAHCDRIHETLACYETAGVPTETGAFLDYWQRHVLRQQD